MYLDAKNRASRSITHKFHEKFIVLALRKHIENNRFEDHGFVKKQALKNNPSEGQRPTSTQTLHKGTAAETQQHPVSFLSIYVSLDRTIVLAFNLHQICCIETHSSLPLEQTKSTAQLMHTKTSHQSVNASQSVLQCRLTCE